MLTSWFTVLLSSGVLLLSGVLCQSSTADSTCPGNDITFLCVTSDNDTFTWVVAPAEGDGTACVAGSIPTCGPMNRFTVSVSEDGSSSTLSVQSVDDILNGTRVECVDGDVDEEICVIDNASAPQILSARVSESDVCDDNGCVVTVEWSEPFISCAGSVSQYVLSVTPPTCDCPSPPNCVVMDGRAVYTLSGSERQHNITVNRSPEYGVTVRADTCDNTLTGEPSSEYIINLTARRRVSQAFTYYYVYALASTLPSIEIIVVSWPRFDFLDVEADYRVVIISGSGSETVIDIETEDDCSGDTCSYTFSSDDITDSYSVAVEVVACTTERFNSTNISSFCDPQTLLVPLSTGLSWSAMTVTTEGLGSFSFDGGSVTYDGVSTGSTATYTTSINFCLNGSREFQSDCVNNEWTPLPVITFEVCGVADLLPCNNPGVEGPNVLCCDSTLCADYDGNTIIGTVTTYSTFDDFCIEDENELMRRYNEDAEWDGSIPTVTRASESQTLSTVNIVLIAIGVVSFSVGVILAVVLAVLLWKKRTEKRPRLCLCIWCGWVGVIRAVVLTVILWKNDGCPRWWYRILLGVSIIVTFLTFIFWLAAFGYIITHDFTIKDRPERLDNSVCDPPNGRVAVRDALVDVSFSLSLLVLGMAIGNLGLWKTGMGCGCDDSTDGGPPKKPQRSKRTKTEEEQEMYDTLNHGKSSSSPQPLLSQTNPDLYGKLGTNKEKDQPETGDTPHYGKLDRGGKSQKEDAPHYGKLDRGKGSTLPATIAAIPPHSDSEYGKLDHSTMESTPHYGKLDQKGGTLPGTVPPGDQYADPNTIEHQAGPTGDLYAMPQQGKRKGKKGKKEEAQSEGSHMYVVSSGQTGDMYYTVSNEPRFKPRQPSGQPGEDGSLL